MSTEDKKTPKSVMLFPNGNTAAFDENGEQIGELQKAWMILYFEFLESQGIDPTKIQNIETWINGEVKYIKAFKTENGFNWSISEF